MISTEETKLRGYTIKHTNKKEFHIIKDEIFNTDSYYVSTVEEAPIIVDFGSHIGISIIYFKLNFPNSKIYAFEPSPSAFQLLVENIFNNGISNVETFNTFVDIKDGSRTVHQDIDGDWLSTTSYLSGSWTGSEATAVIEVESVDAKKIISNILEKENRIDLLKIDIEGYEVKVIDRIKDMLGSIRNLIVEFHPNNIKSFSKTIGVLKKHYSSILYIKEGKNVKAPDLTNLFIIKCSR